MTSAGFSPQERRAGWQVSAFILVGSRSHEDSRGFIDDGAGGLIQTFRRKNRPKNTTELLGTACRAAETPCSAGVGAAPKLQARWGRAHLQCVGLIDVEVLISADRPICAIKRFVEAF